MHLIKPQEIGLLSSSEGGTIVSMTVVRGGTKVSADAIFISLFNKLLNVNSFQTCACRWHVHLDQILY